MVVMVIRGWVRRRDLILRRNGGRGSRDDGVERDPLIVSVCMSRKAKMEMVVMVRRWLRDSCDGKEMALCMSMVKRWYRTLYE